MLPPNHVLQGRYIILRKVGGGGMAAVYQARDQRLANKFWAIKEMSTAQLTTPQALQDAIATFQREARMLSQLNHASLPKVTDFFEDSGRYYLVMDFITGETLDKKLAAQANRPFPEPVVLDWADQLCDVLTYLHSRTPPVIYRDLKPSNIMLDDKGRIFLIDFGIARHFNPAKTTDTIPFGSPGYAPPEQYAQSGQQSDPRSDVYALGVTLHELLTGHDPANTPFNLPPARQLNSAISPQVEQALRQATQRDRNQRFARVEDFRLALRSQAPVGAVSSAGAPPTVQVGPGGAPPPPMSAAIINVSPMGLDFKVVPRGSRPVRGFQIRNLGGGLLTGSVISQAPWLIVSPTTFQGNVPVEIAVDTDQLAPGLNYTTTLTVQSNAGNATVTVNLSLPGEPQPTPRLMAGVGATVFVLTLLAGWGIARLILGWLGVP